MISSVLAAGSGLLFGLSLIVAIGAQNAFVLRQGLRREHIVPVIVICAASDAVLILLGIGGAGLVFDRVPWLVDIVRWAGAAFLTVYGLLAARRALRPGTLAAASEPARGSTLLAVVTTCLALTWLNPHVYLDAMLLIGTAGAREPENARVAFALGAMTASLVWFVSIGYGARFLAPLFRKASAWRLLDGATGGMVLLVAATQLR